MAGTWDISSILTGDIRSIAKAISHVENFPDQAPDLINKLTPYCGKAHVLGITGAPGAGKSTLIDSIAISARTAGKKVAIIAVDPSSPFSGGAVLGDRIRMSRIGGDGDIYLRSLATRGALGGLSRACYDSITILDAAGYDLVIIETVGVGQSEIDVVQLADSVVVILVPGMGDGVQAFKAGILEIADIFVINKADRDGTNSLERELLTLIATNDPDSNLWKQKVALTVATEGKGTPELLGILKEHSEWLKSSAVAKSKKQSNLELLILKIFSEQLVTKLKNLKNVKISELAEKLYLKKISIYEALENLNNSSER